jgi:hypothetical protein
MSAAQILADIHDALRGELGDGYSLISGLVEDQTKLLAEQAQFIADQRANGDLRTNDALYQHFLKGLENNTANLARSVAMLTALTIEKAWNAVANALWGGITGILTAAGLPAPLIPNAPPHI